MPPEQPPLRAVLEYYGITVGPERREVPILCPIHDESRPSASMNEDEGLWHCQACGAGGDALTLIQMKEGMTDDFRAALRFSAQHFGTRDPDLPVSAGRTHSRVPRAQRAIGRGFKPAFRNRPLSGT